MQTIIQYFHEQDIRECEEKQRKITPFFQSKSPIGLPLPAVGEKLSVNPPTKRIQTWNHNDYDRYLGALYVRDIEVEMVEYADAENEDAEFPTVQEAVVKVYVGTHPIDSVSIGEDTTPEEVASAANDALRDYYAVKPSGIQNVFATTVRALREAKGITISGAARALNTTASDISDMELARKPMDIRYAQWLDAQESYPDRPIALKLPEDSAPKTIEDITDYAKRDSDRAKRLAENYKRQSEAAALMYPFMHDRVVTKLKEEFGEENVTVHHDLVVVDAQGKKVNESILAELREQAFGKPLNPPDLTDEQAEELLKQFDETFPGLREKLRATTSKVVQARTEYIQSGTAFEDIERYMLETLDGDSNPHARRQEVEHNVLSSVEHASADGIDRLKDEFTDEHLLAYLQMSEIASLEKSYQDLEKQNYEWAERVTNAETKLFETTQFLKYRLMPRLATLAHQVDGDIKKGDVVRLLKALTEELSDVVANPSVLPEPFPEYEAYRAKTASMTDRQLFTEMRRCAILAVGGLADSDIPGSAQAHLKLQTCGHEAARRLLLMESLEGWDEDLYFGPARLIDTEFHESVRVVEDDVLQFTFAPGWSVEFDKSARSVSIVSPTDSDDVLTPDVALCMVTHTLRAHISNGVVTKFFGAVPPFTASLSQVNMSVMMQVQEDWRFDDASDRLLHRSAKYVPMGSYWEFKLS